MTRLTFGVIGTSKKEDERRVPIHLAHLPRIPEEIRKKLVFEKGYGEPFGISDAEIKAQTGGISSRDDLLTNLGSVIITKPVLYDLEKLRIGGVLWGYVHSVQQKNIAQAAIDRKLSLIAYEDMYYWGSDHQIGLHTFYKNNEIAGYCAVIHALQLKGIDGNYGNQRKIVIFGFGSVSRGAIHALQARGFKDITVCTQRPNYEIREEIFGCNYTQVYEGCNGEARMVVKGKDGTKRPLADLISETDIIINGIFQNLENPTFFVNQSEKECLKPGSLIIDVSCDEGMGFFFAKPTTFKNPMFKYETIDYYSVDHTPSYLWETASRLISEALISFLPTIISGRDGWYQNETIKKAISIEGGVVKAPSILSFQKRKEDYPHDYINLEG